MEQYLNNTWPTWAVAAGFPQMADEDPQVLPGSMSEHMEKCQAKLRPMQRQQITMANEIEDHAALRNARKVLFLDFDGVLHPWDVYPSPHDGQPYLEGSGHLFMWAPILEGILQDHPDVKIVLSTSWARDASVRYAGAKAALPKGLQARVVGAVLLHRFSDTRYRLIAEFAKRRGFNEWIAIDDDTDGWPASEINRLVATSHHEGLGNPAAQDRLRQLLV
ncbi:HAD domain-containing protein [Niveibacterium sp. COAC-50]|uniref:HAD domain-containing protein n=1 Tax=Niveibacterium sp. COAC-50 TaxID=2729384 RepID=UPI001C12DA19|nr:HAD domain-containing protein [Niveibacterium sp. COAC-50]